MQDLDTTNRSPSGPRGQWSSSTRNAALAVGGAVLLALGIAAGVMMGRPDINEAPLDYAPPAAGTAEPLAAPDSAAQPPTNNRTTDEDKPRSNERGAATSSREGTSASAGPREYESRTLARAVCNHCGIVESVTPVPIQNKSTGVGAVAGGVVGGVVGNQVGKGSGNTAATVLGAIGGGIAGNEIEKRQRTSTVYRVKVRMDDGTVRTFTRETDVPTGSRVEVRDGEMRVTSREG